jgi:hypothetical protein
MGRWAACVKWETGVEVAREAKCGGSRFLKIKSGNMACRHRFALRLRGKRSSQLYKNLRIILGSMRSAIWVRGLFALVNGRKKGLVFREESLSASGCVVSKTYRHRSYKDSASEYRYCAAVGLRDLAGKEIWWGEWGLESGC